MLDLILTWVAEFWGGITDRRARVKKAGTRLAKDLELLSFLYIARFIVWRELRRRRREGLILTLRE